MAEDSDWVHCNGKMHVLEIFKQWKRDAKKRNKATLADFKDE